jgi:probable phosphoglycerate mutase
VVRHGETEWSAALRHTGRSDIPLSAAGRRRASELGSALRGNHFDLVFSSPLLRATETCELAGFGPGAILCEDLREWDYGDYEGLTTAEIRERNPGWYLWRDGCPGGETPEQVGVRADRALDVFVERNPATVLAFAHGHILRVLAARWIAMEPAAGARLMLATGALGVLGHERETRAIERWNATALQSV